MTRKTAVKRKTASPNQKTGVKKAKESETPLDKMQELAKKMAGEAEKAPVSVATSGTYNADDVVNQISKLMFDSCTLDKLDSDGWFVCPNFIFHATPDFDKNGVDLFKKVAAFDMDSTLIETKSGKVFAQDENDWVLWNAAVIPEMKSLHQRGYTIAIISNQAGIEAGKISIPKFKQKFQNVSKALQVPCVGIFSILSGTIYRKPCTGMWFQLLQTLKADSKYLKQFCEKNSKVATDSFYCGDAAGRPVNWKPKKKKDFAASDRLFAENLGISFVTPEELFLKEAKFPVTLSDAKHQNGSEAQKIAITKPLASQELLVLVGPPAVGKSTLATTLFHTYTHVNRDTLKTQDKCVAAAKTALDAGKSVIVDNTNPDKDSRAKYVELASARSTPARCLVFGVETMEIAKRQEVLRRIMSVADPSLKHDKVPGMVYNMWKSKFVAPTVAEGFRSIENAVFLPKFRSSFHEYIFNLSM